MKTGILLVNLGTPDSPKPGDVYRYLQEFLLDERVIDLPAWKRQLLVRGIIVPFRYRKSARIYRKIWETSGSPLLKYGIDLQEKLQTALGADFYVSLGMRYQNPTIAAALNELRQKNPDRIVICPLFPQYASATTGSIHKKVMMLISKWQVIPGLHFINSYFDHPLFIEAFVARGRNYDITAYDHVLFSFHGLPERQIKKADPADHCLKENCCDQIEEVNKFCYRAQCFDTAGKIARTLKIPPERYTVCFQSRLGKTPWIRPYAEDILQSLASSDVKKVLVFSPAFVADCLETIYEIGQEYDEEFRNIGGEKIQLVESLNTSEEWVTALQAIILEKLK